MTTTSTGAHRFQTGNIIMLGVALATIAAIVFILWTATQSQQEIAAPNEAPTVQQADATTQEGRGNSLTEAYNDGRLGEGTTTNEAQASSGAASSTSSISGGHQEFSNPSGPMDRAAAASALPTKAPIGGGPQEFSDPVPNDRAATTPAPAQPTSISGGYQE